MIVPLEWTDLTLPIAGNFLSGLETHGFVCAGACAF